MFWLVVETSDHRLLLGLAFDGGVDALYQHFVSEQSLGQDDSHAPPHTI